MGSVSEADSPKKTVSPYPNTNISAVVLQLGVGFNELLSYLYWDFVWLDVLKVFAKQSVRTALTCTVNTALLQMSITSGFHNFSIHSSDMIPEPGT